MTRRRGVSNAMESSGLGWQTLVLGLFLWAFAGCSERGLKNPDGSARPSHRPGLYPDIATQPAINIARARPIKPENQAWTNAAFAVVETELSPAILVHSSSSYLALFQDLDRFGLGTPAYAAYSALSGPKGFKKGEMQPVIGMEENWLILWFTGEKGWTNWDSPWAVFLQHKPTAMILDETGLQIQFHEPAGDVVLMPLYGYEKMPLPGNEKASAPGHKPRGIKTWKWGEFLTKDLLMRVRYWASASRRFPLYCEDSFSVDASSDTVTIRQRFQWHAIADDWKTRPLRVAPLSPPLALAVLDQGFPLKVSKSVQDLDFFTPCGPYMGVENVDAYDVAFPVLQYVHETRAHALPPTNAPPVVAAALERLRVTAQMMYGLQSVHDADQGGSSNAWPQADGCLWYAKALPYYDAVTRSNALAGLKKFFSEEILVTNRFKLEQFPSGSGRLYAVPSGDGISAPGEIADAAAASASLLEPLWTYAHFTGDWDLIKERWPLVQRLFTAPAKTRWSGFGRDGVVALGDQAAPCLAMARMAYRVGDIDTYHYACSLFARELVHHYAKQRGASYFRKHQPWHSMEPLDAEVYLTQLRSGTAGWDIDGPNYPAGATVRQYESRWVRFENEDVGRFYFEHLKEDVRSELNRLAARWDAKHRSDHDPQRMPSLAQLRSMLLQETPEQLAQLDDPPSVVMASARVLATCLAMVQASQPPHWQRLIPSAARSPFVVGPERDVPGPNANLTESVLTTSTPTSGNQGALDWPSIGGWTRWKTPSGDDWTFGKFKPVRDTVPMGVSVVELNWNTKVTVYEY